MTDFDKDFDNYDALGLAELVRRKEVKPIELVETVIERIERVNPSLNCVNIKTYDLARQLAEDVLPAKPLAGVPFLMKDLDLLYAGVKTTNACSFLKDYVPPDDSVVVQRYKRAGLILVGKTPTPEGANITTESRLYGPTHNPWNAAYSPGGSSGGSAVSVAARVVPIADGNDGGGSIRIPACFNGVVGLKPCRGRVTYAPHYGDMWYGMACNNCLSLTVRDTAAFLDVIAGNVPGDPYQPPNPQRTFLEEIAIDPGKLRIGFTTKSPNGTPIHPVCIEAVKGATKLLAELGHEMVEMEFTYDFKSLLETVVLVLNPLAAHDLEVAETLIGRAPTQDDFEGTTWEMAQRGRALTAMEHVMHLETLRQFGRQIATDCEPYDAVLTPTMPDPPAKLGSYPQDIELDPFFELIGPQIAFTLAYNVSGQPAMSVPFHWMENGLPIGVQLGARYADEATILRLAAQIEKAKPWIDRKPPVCA